MVVVRVPLTEVEGDDDAPIGGGLEPPQQLMSGCHPGRITVHDLVFVGASGQEGHADGLPVVDNMQ